MTEPECLVCGLPGQWVVKPRGLRIWACSMACADWIEKNYRYDLDARVVPEPE